MEPSAAPRNRKVAANRGFGALCNLACPKCVERVTVAVSVMRGPEDVGDMMIMVAMMRKRSFFF